MGNYHLLTDDELIQRLQTGEEKAFTEIYDRYWEKLLAIGYYHTRDKQSAEDIVHDVMTSLWTRKADLEIQSINAYLATAVKFAVFKAIARDKKRREILAALHSSEHFSDVEEKLDAKFLQEYLRGELEQLPEKTQLVFNYSRGKELSIAGIAKKTDLSPKAVEYHITKALRALRNKLQKLKPFFI
jgi:RNA polymerase sigma-70 factor (ECF subfamily)